MLFVVNLLSGLLFKKSPTSSFFLSFFLSTSPTAAAAASPCGVAPGDAALLPLYLYLSIYLEVWVRFAKRVGSFFWRYIAAVV